MSLAKNLTIEHDSPALLLQGGNDVMGGIQAIRSSEVCVCSFSNHNLSFVNGADPNLFYKMATMRLDKDYENVRGSVNTQVWTQTQTPR